MPGYFVLRGDITHDILNAADEGSPHFLQLEELLKRRSECDYKTQFLEGLQVDHELFNTINNEIRRNNTIPTTLPSAKRYFINTKESAIKSTGDLVPCGTTKGIMINKGVRDLITSHENLPDTFLLDETLINSGTCKFNFTGNGKYIINVKLALGIGGTGSPLGVGHPAPVFTAPADDNTHQANASSIPVSIVIRLWKTGEVTEDHILTTVNFYRSNISAFDIFHVFGSLSFTTGSSDMEINSVTNAQMFITAGNSIATFSGANPNVYFVKQIAALSPLIDSSNYMELIKL